MIEVSLLPSAEISRHRNWHEPCHVDNDGRGDPEAADASLHWGGESNSTGIALIDSTFKGFGVPSRCSQPLDRDNNWFHSLFSQNKSQGAVGSSRSSNDLDTLMAPRQPFVIVSPYAWLVFPYLSF